jgi:predicted ATPase
VTTLADFERRAKALADARDVLTSIVTGLNTGIEALKRDSMRDMKAAVRVCAEQHDKLLAMIEENPALFTKPKSTVQHGLKFGFRKGTGGLEFEDGEQVVKLIRKHFPEQFDTLVNTTEKPAKKALAELTAAELKKLGVTVEDTGEVPFIKPADSAVDKLVEQLLKSATEESS